MKEKAGDVQDRNVTRIDRGQSRGTRRQKGRPKGRTFGVKAFLNGSTKRIKSSLDAAFGKRGEVELKWPRY